LHNKVVLGCDSFAIATKIDLHNKLCKLVDNKSTCKISALHNKVVLGCDSFAIATKIAGGQLPQHSKAMPNTTKLCRVAIKDRDRAAIEDCCRQPAQQVVLEKISAGLRHSHNLEKKKL
jgi:hypothetical protein